MKKLLLSCVGLAVAQVASAAITTVSGDFNATNWSLIFNSTSPTAPIDPLHLKYSVTFDDALSYTKDSSVLSVISSNIPYSFDFSYDAGNSSFTLATFSSGSSCSNPSSSFCAFVTVATGTPFFVQQTTSTGDFWIAQTITAVPEPSTWAMLIAGVSIVGASVRRQRAGAA